MRAVYVYLPSIERKERWEEYGRRQGTSISKFVAEHVEGLLRQEADPSYRSRGELWKRGDGFAGLGQGTGWGEADSETRRNLAWETGRYSQNQR